MHFKQAIIATVGLPAARIVPETNPNPRTGGDNEAARNNAARRRAPRREAREHRRHCRRSRGSAGGVSPLRSARRRREKGEGGGLHPRRGLPRAAVSVSVSVGITLMFVQMVLRIVEDVALPAP